MATSGLQDKKNSNLVKIISLVSGFALAVAIHTGSLIWVLSSIKTTVSHMTDEIGELKQSIADSSKERYTASDANRDQQFIFREIDELKDRISDLENENKSKTKNP